MFENAHFFLKYIILFIYIYSFIHSLYLSLSLFEYRNAHFAFKRYQNKNVMFLVLQRSTRISQYNILHSNAHQT
jgi:hypothetical protein